MRTSLFMLKIPAFVPRARNRDDGELEQWRRNLYSVICPLFSISREVLDSFSGEKTSGVAFF